MAELSLALPAGAPGWVVVEAQLDPRYRHSYSCLRVRRRSRPDDVEEIPLPVFLDGRIAEVVKLPDDTRALAWLPPGEECTDPSVLRIRRIGAIERIARFAVRVIRTSLRITKDLRREAGLTPLRSLCDPARAYRVATAFRVCYPLMNYAEWIDRLDTLQEGDVAAIRTHLAGFTARPRFHLLLCDAADRENVRDSLRSLRGQLYPEFTCTVLDETDAPGGSLDTDRIGLGAQVVAGRAIEEWLAGFNARLGQEAGNDWIMLMRAGDRLPAHALYWLACEVLAQRGATVLYSDDDALDEQGRRIEPRLKPDWSPAHLYSTHYIGAAAALLGSAVHRSGGIHLEDCRHGNYDLLLRITRSSDAAPTHVPAVLYHRRQRTAQGSAWEHPQWCLEKLRAHLAREGIEASVSETATGCRRVRYRLPEPPPMVSLIVPTRDAVGLLRQCVDSVLEKTRYPRFEILVVDNQSSDPETHAYFARLAEQPSVRVLRYDRPFNFSAINNFAAREARGEVLCLLNNDIEVLAPDWLQEMVGHLMQKQVGVVGAKLLYPDGRVQHAGVAVGPGGCALHLHVQLDRDQPGYCNRALVAHELSAVTGACLVTRKDLYEKLGGLNETALTVAFNDVDYCLRVLEAGCRVIFTPHAELLHHESATRGMDTTLRKRLRAFRELSYMRRTWSRRMRHDPYYNLNLTYWRADFSLTETQRVKKPWLQEASGGRRNALPHATLP